MHWSDKIAKQVVEARPDKDIYVCAAGISPSGSVHIGNFRDVATVYFTAKAIAKLGKKVRMLFSWDDFDRFRKVPANIPDNFSEYLGKPCSGVPDPFGCHDSYAKHFEREFETTMEAFGIPLEYRYQTKEYQSGRYAEGIRKALLKRREIYDILAKFRTGDASDAEREAYYPISIYCTQCGKDETDITYLSPDAVELAYRCRCGHEETVDITRGGNFKLPWKVDWPMRWMYEEVDFEPGGKDHATPGGSYYVSRIISSAVYDYPAPIFHGYEFVGLSGAAGKMSGSSGMAVTPGDLLKLYPPEMILWFFAKFAPKKAFSISLDEEILRHYDEFDRALISFLDGKAKDQVRANMELCLVEGRTVHPVPFRQLASFSTIFRGNLDALEKMFARLGTPFSREEFSERLKKAEFWLATCSPESVINLNETKDTPFFETLTDTEKKWVRKLHQALTEKPLGFEEMTTMLYAIPKEEGIDDQENKTRQRRFFSIIYQLLIGKEKGPRLATFLTALGQDKILHLLDFS